MALVTTPGAANATSYASLVEALAYVPSDPRISVFRDSDEEAQEAFLVVATRLLDAMPQAWAGAAATDTQSLGFPRTGLKTRNGFTLSSTVVPVELKNAQIEFAYRLAEEDRTSDNDVLNQNIRKVQASTVAVQFQDRSKFEEGPYIDGVPTAVAAGWLMVPDVVKVLIPPPWLLPTVAQKGTSFLFEVL